jgi:hypothetical protein
MAKGKKKNKYARKAKQASVLSMQSLPTKGDVKNTLLETGKDLLIGVVGGGLAGAAIGKPSLLIGAAITGAGHYTENRLISILGIGMMAANGFQGSSVNGLEGLEGVKERVMAYKDSFSQKLFLDKVLKKKASATNGIGELQYFNYQNEANFNGMNGELAALDSIEQQIEDSAMRQMQITGSEDLEGMYEMEGVGLVDVTDYNI